MARGIRATTRQKVAGKHNLQKAHMARLGTRGTHYRKKM